MTDVNNTFEDEEDEEEIETPISPEEAAAAKRTLAERCKIAGIGLEESSNSEGEWETRVGIKCGRTVRWLPLWSDEGIQELLKLPFENYSFLSDLEAICSYSDGTIEALIRPISSALLPTSSLYRRLFKSNDLSEPDLDTAAIIIAPTHEGLPKIEISARTDLFEKFSRTPYRRQITLKLSGCHCTTHDSALALLNRVAGSLFFQLDLLIDVPLALERERRRINGGRRTKRSAGRGVEVQYPRTQFENAPLSLYWYAKSAKGMPLLQFLAFYQVIEFYFPIYSQSEAQRRLKTILKDPTFRADRDSDIAKLLSSIHVSRSGAFGDERSQLRATLSECVDPLAVRQFLEQDVDRKDFFLTKAKAQPYHKIPLANPAADLRNDIADRIYDIRCRIVHTKSDSRDGNVDLLLPFTPEAEQLSFEIELAEHLAQLVLIAASTPFNMHG